MKALAADALATNNQSFLTLAKSQLEQLQQKTTHDLDQRRQAVEHLVAPIKESLQKVDGKLQELEVARQGAYRELKEQVRQLTTTQKELRDADLDARDRAPQPRLARQMGRDAAAQRR